MTCRVCSQELRERTKATHHLERSPVEPDICLGCWIGCIEIEKFLLRATGRTFWTLKVEAVMVQILRSLDQ
jgi:hypothetical protein